MNNPITSTFPLRNNAGAATSNQQVQLFALILLSFVIVYFVSGIVSQLFFLIILIIIYSSRDLPFWIAFCFLIFDGPGRLFLPVDAINRIGLPAYGFPGFSFLYQELFVIVILIRAYNKKPPWMFVFRKDIIILGVFLLFTFFITYKNGFSVTSSIQMTRDLLPVLLIYSFSKLLTSGAEIKRLDSFLFPMVFIAFASQIYTFFSGAYLLDSFVNRTSVDPRILQAGGEEAARVYNCVYLLMYCFFKALLYFFRGDKSFKRFYLLLLIIIPFISLLLSATRGWILAYLAVFILTSLNFSTSRRAGSILQLLLGLIVFTLVLSIISPVVSKQLDQAEKRLFTLKSISQGDLSAKGTSSRITERGPKVLSKAMERPVFGWGFSDTFYKYRDGHVGHHTMLLNVGVFGYLIFTVIFIKWLIITHKYATYKYPAPNYGKTLIIYMYSIIFIYIVHSTSRMYWGFTLGDKMVSFFAFFLLLTSFNNDIKQRNVSLVNKRLDKN